MLDALRGALTRRGVLLAGGAASLAPVPWVAPVVSPVLRPRAVELFDAVERFMREGDRHDFEHVAGPYRFSGASFDFGFRRGVAIEVGNARHAVSVPRSMIENDGPAEAAAVAISSLLGWVAERER